MPCNKTSARLQAFTSWPFLLSLATLLLNDLYLKLAYHNWVTGKLSDFSGVFMLTILVSVIFPGYPRITGLSVASAFTIWKSPLSEPVIGLIQSLGVVHFGRVVDYSDLFSLIMIPPAIMMVSNPIKITFPMVRKVLVVPVVILTLFAIMGTSLASISQEYMIRKVDEAPCPDPADVIASIDKVALSQNLKPCGIPGKLSGAYRGGRIEMCYSVDENGSARFLVRGIASGLFFVRYPKKEMEKLKNAMMSELGNKFQNMEFVIPLDQTKKPF
jgi:hypothetical protein